MTRTFQPQQNYKSRAEAYRLFVLAQGLPVGQTKFYNDCDGYKLVNTDKSINLSSLLAYVKAELQVDPSTGQSLVQRNNAQEMEELELRKLRAETERRERVNEDAARNLDRNWLHRESAEESLAAIVGTLQDALDHQIYIGAPGLIHTAAGDAARVDEVTELMRAMVSSAFAEVLALDKIEAVFGADGAESEEI